MRMERVRLTGHVLYDILHAPPFNLPRPLGWKGRAGLNATFM